MKIAFLSIFLQSSLSLASGLLGQIVGPSSLPAGIALRPFTSDGCSMAPDGLADDRWVHCCIEHDIQYWAGGTKEEKLASDNQLRSCIAQQGHPDIAEIFFQSVRTFGSPWLQTTYRWGYGWNKIRGYSPLTEAERAISEKFYGPELKMLYQKLQQGLIPIESLSKTLESLPNEWTENLKLVSHHLHTHLYQDQIVTKMTEQLISLSQRVYRVYTDRCPQGYEVSIHRRPRETRVSARSICPLKP